MAWNTAQLNTQLGRMHDHFPFTLTFDYSTYTYNEVNMSPANLATLEKEIINSTIKIVAVQASDFATAPVMPDDKVTIDDVVYRVLQTTDSPDGGLERRLFLGKEFGQ